MENVERVMGVVNDYKSHEEDNLRAYLKGDLEEFRLLKPVGDELLEAWRGVDDLVVYRSIEDMVLLRAREMYDNGSDDRKVAAEIENTYSQQYTQDGMVYDGIIELCESYKVEHEASLNEWALDKVKRIEARASSLSDLD